MKPINYDRNKENTLNHIRFAKKPKRHNPRAKHPHEYIEVMLLIKRYDFSDCNTIHDKAYRTTLCVHCGKIKSIVSMEKVQGEKGTYYVSLTRAEMLEKYPDLLKFTLEDRVYKHPYEIEEQKFLDIHSMYKAMVEDYMPDGLSVSTSDVHKGLMNNIHPENMAKMIIERNQEREDLNENLD